MKKVILYVLFAYIITWTFWYLNYLCVIEKLDLNEKGFHILGIFGPFFSSLIVTYLYDGRQGINSLLKQGLKIRVKFIWYLISLLVFPIISLISLIIQNSFQINLIDFSAFNNILDLFVLFIIMLLFAPIGEEFGWRGFLLNHLQEKYSPLFSTIIVGIIWGIWHLPFFLIPGKILNDFYNLSKMILLLFPVYTIGMSIIYTWIYNKTNQSIFMLILLHCMTNWSFETFYPNKSLYGLNITYCLVIFIGICIVLFNYKSWIKIKRTHNTP